MLDNEPGTGEAPAADPTQTRPTRRRRATKAAGSPEQPPDAAATPAEAGTDAPADAPAPKKATRTRRKATAAEPASGAEPAPAPTEAAASSGAAGSGVPSSGAAGGGTAGGGTAEGAPAPVKKATRSRRKATAAAEVASTEHAAAGPAAESTPAAQVSATAPAAADAATTQAAAVVAPAQGAGTAAGGEAAAGEAAPPRRTRRRSAAKAAAEAGAPADGGDAGGTAAATGSTAGAGGTAGGAVAGTAGDAGDAAAGPFGSRARAVTSTGPALVPPPVITFLPPDAAAVTEAPAPTRRRTRKAAAEAEPAAPAVPTTPAAADTEAAAVVAEPAGPEDDAEDEAGGRRRRRGRRGRGKGRTDAEGADDAAETEAVAEADTADDEDEAEAGQTGTKRRRRRRRRGGGAGEDASPDDPPNTVVHVREAKAAGDEVQSVKGSTRLEAKRQRRREGRETQRRRPPILTEAEFLARREAVERQMVVRQSGDRTQIAVLEDGVLVEHYVTKSGSMSYAGNVYLGKVQNVLPSMEAAFIDIGKGRNAVLYAGEVNWDVSGLEGKARSIEQALRPGDAVMVQVTKDPLGHKGARLTSQISLPGRYLVYVPGGSMTGISRKLPDTERQRLKEILKRIVPDDAGVIIRTAAEGATEEELTRDVSRLQAQWQVIGEKAAKGGAPALLSEEPDLAIRVVRDVFNEDFTEIVVAGKEAAETLEQYIEHVAPDLLPRLHKHTAGGDVFHDLRIDEQLMKALDRKVWLPSGGSLVIDRTEAMTVVDVNTGKFTGKGGNLEETVTRNNLEAAEEIVRQLRLRDVGGIIVIDFIDMVLESNRELVLRRLMECLGRDRTKHQVAEVTSLGLVQMTRKRVGQGLLEAFSEPCEVCKGRGILIHTEPVDDSRRRSGTPAKKAEPKAEPAAEQPAGTGRTRRSRKASAPAGPAPAADDGAVEPEPPAADPPGEDGAAEPAEVARAATAAAGLPADTLDVAASAAEEPDVEPVSGAGAPRKRRRRAASRPAGPPVSAASG